MILTFWVSAERYAVNERVFGERPYATNGPFARKRRSI